MFVFISVSVKRPSNIDAATRSEHLPPLCTTALQAGVAAPLLDWLSRDTFCKPSQPALEHFQGWDLLVRSQIWKFFEPPWTVGQKDPEVPLSHLVQSA